MRKILVVCMGNICRSPLGARLLGARLGGRAEVTSAGLQALTGYPADEVTSAVAADHGVVLEDHVARAYSAALGLKQDLILVMEPGFREVVAAEEPALFGRTLLFDQWTGAAGIPDPFRHSRTFHEIVFQQIETASDAWAARLAAGW